MSGRSWAADPVTGAGALVLGGALCQDWRKLAGADGPAHGRIADGGIRQPQHPAASYPQYSLDQLAPLLPGHG